MTTQVTGKTWAIRVPSNAATMWIEVYPKAPTPTAWLNNYRGYTGVAAGSTNTSTYSTTMRRDLRIGSGLSNIQIVLPKSCHSATGGGTYTGGARREGRSAAKAVPLMATIATVDKRTLRITLVFLSGAECDVR